MLSVLPSLLFYVEVLSAMVPRAHSSSREAAQISTKACRCSTGGQRCKVHDLAGSELPLHCFWPSVCSLVHFALTSASRNSLDLQDPTFFVSPSDPHLVPEQTAPANHEQSGYGEPAGSARLEQLLWQTRPVCVLH